MENDRMTRPVSCPAASEQYSPTCRVALTSDCHEGDVICVKKDASKYALTRSSGIVSKRAKFEALTHEQVKPQFSFPNISCMLAICIDSSAKNNVVSCQRYGAVNLLLHKGIKMHFGDTLAVHHIDDRWTTQVPPSMKNTILGEVVAVYANNPAQGFTTVRVRLTLDPY